LRLADTELKALSAGKRPAWAYARVQAERAPGSLVFSHARELRHIFCLFSSIFFNYKI
jgi:hypothetical protein